MAASVYGNIRLDTALTGSLPTSTYKVNFEAFKDLRYAGVTTERGLDGQLQLHRTTDGSGDILLFHDAQYGLILTQAEYLALYPELGKVMYFMPHLRDEAAPLDYRYVVTFERMVEIGIYDPAMEYFKATVYLKDSDGLTVDT